MEDRGFAEEDLVAVTAAVWDSALGLDLSPARDGARRATRKPESGGEPSACVAISGAFSGAVLLRFHGKLAERCAGKLFAKAKPSRDEVREAMGELAAMVAGNVKSLIPGTSKLSLAVVADGGDPQLSVPGTHGAAEVDLQCEGKRLRVTLMRQDI